MVFSYPVPKSRKNKQQYQERPQYQSPSGNQQHQAPSGHQGNQQYQAPPGAPPSLSNLSQWFQHYDRNGSGGLEREEVILALLHTMGASGNQFDPQVIRETVYSVWTIFDHDNSGSIDINEFCAPGGLGESLTAVTGGGGSGGGGNNGRPAPPSQPGYAPYEPDIQITPGPNPQYGQQPQYGAGGGGAGGNNGRPAPPSQPGYVPHEPEIQIASQQPQFVRNSQVVQQPHHGEGGVYVPTTVATPTQNFIPTTPAYASASVVQAVHVPAYPGAPGAPPVVQAVHVPAYPGAPGAPPVPSAPPAYNPAYNPNSNY